MVIYFAGDTGYSPHFKLIGQKFPKINLAFLPIGAYKPRYIMKMVHMNPDDAVQAAQDLNAQNIIGIHLGTFHLSDEGINDPVTDLIQSIKTRNFVNKFIAPKNGQTIYIQDN